MSTPVEYRKLEKKLEEQKRATRWFARLFAQEFDEREKLEKELEECRRGRADRG